jgi:hypothetical protein
MEPVGYKQDRGDRFGVTLALQVATMEPADHRWEHRTSTCRLSCR